MKLGTGTYKEKFLEDLDFCLTNFDVLELQDFIMPDILENPKIIKDYQKMLDGFPGEITLHGPYLNLVPTSIDKKIKAVAELRYLQAIEAAQKIGAKKIVIHSFYDKNSGYSGYNDLWLEENLMFWPGFIEKIKNGGVTILFENVYDLKPETFAKLIASVNSPLFATCIDIGHCNCLSHFKAEIWIQKVRGYYFHISDNDGVNDNHWIPGKGNIDFDRISHELASFQEIYLISEAVADFQSQFESLKSLKENIESRRACKVTGNL